MIIRYYIWKISKPVTATTNQDYTNVQTKKNSGDPLEFYDSMDGKRINVSKLVRTRDRIEP
jgi:hypothetical protein